MSNLVYRTKCLPCSEHNEKDIYYIGQTKQYIHRRFLGHKSDINCDNEGISGLSSHARTSGHRFSFDHVDILHCETNLDRRRILESLYISVHQPNLNQNLEFNNVANIFGHILDAS